MITEIITDKDGKVVQVGFVGGGTAEEKEQICKELMED